DCRSRGGSRHSGEELRVTTGGQERTTWGSTSRYCEAQAGHGLLPRLERGPHSLFFTSPDTERELGEYFSFSDC
ncbi:hypothetical protein NDU88_004684, partial [Pleurodeles waltl]